MKRFYVNENSTVFADLTQITGINVYCDTVNVYLTSGGVPRIYTGENHEDAINFAKKLAAEVEAAKEAHLTKVLKQHIEESEKHALKFIADNSEKPITDIYGRTIEPIQISALYINEIGDVRAVTSDDDIVTLKQLENTEKDNYIDALARRCNLYTASDFRLYVDPVSVKKVYIDDGGDDNYKLCVQVYDFDLAAATFDNCNDAITTLKKLKKDFKLE